MGVEIGSTLEAGLEAAGKAKNHTPDIRASVFLALERGKSRPTKAGQNAICVRVVFTIIRSVLKPGEVPARHIGAPTGPHSPPTRASRVSASRKAASATPRTPEKKLNERGLDGGNVPSRRSQALADQL